PPRGGSRRLDARSPRQCPGRPDRRLRTGPFAFGGRGQHGLAFQASPRSRQADRSRHVAGATYRRPFNRPIWSRVMSGARPPLSDNKPSRRAVLAAGGLVAAGVAGAVMARRALRPKASAFIAREQRYDGELRRTIEDGLVACGVAPVSFPGKRVLLKPNLV